MTKAEINVHNSFVRSTMVILALWVGQKAVARGRHERECGA